MDGFAAIPESGTIRVFHTGYEEIPSPDIRYGRKNADFGQGFYLSGSDAFAGKWARQRKDADIIVNSYELCLTGLALKRFSRDEEWLGYIFANRGGYDDSLAQFDVIAGPIANDTIYDTLGIFTSGVLSRAEEESYQRAVAKALEEEDDAP